MRRDAARLAELLSAAGTADAARLGALGRWYACFAGAVRDHNRIENVIIYPALGERDPTFRDIEGALEGQHRLLADRLAVTRESVGALAAATAGRRWESEHREAVRAALALQGIVDAHTRNEEAVAFSRCRDAFTADEYEDLFRAGGRMVGERAAFLAGLWVLDPTPACAQSELLAAQPLRQRLTYHLATRPRCDRLARPTAPDSATGAHIRRCDMPTIPWRTTAEVTPDRNYLILASQLPLRSHRMIPRFLGLTLSVVRQLERTEGVVGYSLFAQPLKRTFWTLSAWTDQHALDAFVRTMPHLGVMGKLRPHMGPTRFTTWSVAGSALPVPWAEAVERVMGSSANPGRATS
jgi:hypothetical protein